MKVVTLNATYVIDLERMKVLRLPQEGAAPPLRRDGEELTLLAVPSPVLGERMNMLVQVREDGQPTLRSTSQVTEVKK